MSAGVRPSSLRVPDQDGVCRRDRHRIDPCFLTERQQQALIRQQIFKRGSLQIVCLRGRTNVRRTEARQRHETLQARRIGEKKGQYLQRERFATREIDKG